MPSQSNGTFTYTTAAGTTITVTSMGEMNAYELEAMRRTPVTGLQNLAVDAASRAALMDLKAAEFIVFTKAWVEYGNAEVTAQVQAALVPPSFLRRIARRARLILRSERSN
jgi:hypothetical protein